MRDRIEPALEAAADGVLAVDQPPQLFRTPEVHPSLLTSDATHSSLLDCRRLRYSPGATPTSRLNTS